MVKWINLFIIQLIFIGAGNCQFFQSNLDKKDSESFAVKDEKEGGFNYNSLNSLNKDKTIYLNDSTINDTHNDSAAIRIKRHAIFLGGGNAILFMEKNINYEFVLIQSKKLKTTAFAIQIGFGTYMTAFDGEGECFNPKLILLRGKGYRFFEFALGANLYTDIDQYFWSPAYVPVVNIGYREHFFSGRAMIRLGLGYPTGFYVGFGIRL